MGIDDRMSKLQKQEEKTKTVDKNITIVVIVFSLLIFAANYLSLYYTIILIVK